MLKVQHIWKVIKMICGNIIITVKHDLQLLDIL